LVFCAFLCTGVCFAFPFSSDSDTQGNTAAGGGCCRQDTQAAMQLPGHKNLRPFAMHHDARPPQRWGIFVRGARETSASCLSCCCRWASTRASATALPGCEGCVRTGTVHTASNAPACSRETPLLDSGPAVCPPASSFVEVSNKEMASALEPAQGGRCMEI